MEECVVAEGAEVPAAGNQFWRQIEDLKSGPLIKLSPGFLVHGAQLTVSGAAFADRVEAPS